MVARRAFDIEDDTDEDAQDNLTGMSPVPPDIRPRVREGMLARLQRSPALVILGIAVLVVCAIFLRGGGDKVKNPSKLKFVSWNIAAINNNPFEYWITHEDVEYKELMKDVQEFIDSPGDGDVPVNTVLTPEMLEELATLMKAEKWEGVDEAVEHFKEVYAEKKIISGFIKDGDLGKKRLVSMPDRITNTINLQGGKTANRPTVINCYGKTFAGMQSWWSQWTAFMFKSTLALSSGQKMRPCELLGPISRAKYPALSEKEEKISKPLSTIAAAAFDGILVHMLDTAAEGKHKNKWQPLRQEMCTALNSKKNERTVSILSGDVYSDADVIFLQECAGAFVKKLRSSRLGRLYEVIVTTSSDGKRDQNSVILLRRSRFDVSTVKEHTESFDEVIANKAGKDVPIAPGDVLVIGVRDTSDKAVPQGLPYLLASFHGDTNGLATVPVVKAMAELAGAANLADHTLVFGLDANTYEQGSSSKQGVNGFANEYKKLSMTSCWGDNPDPKNHTTFNARTYLQPQLNKAVGLSDMDKPGVGDKNPKDFILFPKGIFNVLQVLKDNTGDGVYIENMVFPTLKFPSDHGVLSTVVERVAGDN